MSGNAGGLLAFSHLKLRLWKAEVRESLQCYVDLQHLRITFWFNTAADYGRLFVNYFQKLVNFPNRVM